MSPASLLALIAPPGFGAVLMLAAVALVAVVAGVVPLRGGHGQHSHAGPGALSVWQLHEPAEFAGPAPDARTAEPVEPVTPGTESPFRREVEAGARPFMARPLMVQAVAMQAAVAEPVPDEVAWPSGGSRLAPIRAGHSLGPELPAHVGGAPRLLERGALWEPSEPRCVPGEADYIGRHRLLETEEKVPIDVVFAPVVTESSSGTWAVDRPWKHPAPGLLATC